MSAVTATTTRSIASTRTQDHKQQTQPITASWRGRLIKWFTAPTSFITFAVNTAASSLFFFLQRSPCVPQSIFQASWTSLVSSVTGLASLILLLLSNQKIKTLFCRLVADYNSIKTKELSLKQSIIKYYAPGTLQFCALTTQVATFFLTMQKEAAPCFSEFEQTIAMHATGLETVGSTFLQLFTTILFYKSLYDNDSEEKRIFSEAKTQCRKPSQELLVALRNTQA